jgi:hypothetical protein
MITFAQAISETPLLIKIVFIGSGIGFIFGIIQINKEGKAMCQSGPNHSRTERLHFKIKKFLFNFENLIYEYRQRRLKKSLAKENEIRNEEYLNSYGRRALYPNRKIEAKK